MQTTGYFLTTFLHYVVVMLAALPVVAILAKALFKKEIFTWLLLVCINEIISLLCLYFVPSLTSFHAAIINTSQLISFACFTLMVRSSSEVALIRNVVGVLLVSVLSVFSTYYFLNNLNIENTFAQVVLQLAVFLLMIWLFNITMMHHPITVFSSAAFWIATGSFFYYTISLLFTFFTRYFPSLPEVYVNEVTTFLLIVKCIALAFYFVATLVKTAPPKNT